MSDESATRETQCVFITATEEARHRFSDLARIAARPDNPELVIDLLGDMVAHLATEGGQIELRNREDKFMVQVRTTKPFPRMVGLKA